MPKPVLPRQVDGQAVPQMTQEQAPGSVWKKAIVPLHSQLIHIDIIGDYIYIYIGLSHYPTVFALLPHVTFTLRYWRDQLNSIHV